MGNRKTPIAKLLPYHPGPLPYRAQPRPGESIFLELQGLPPYKDRSRSIRNPTHPRYQAFVALRREAIRAMAGRACYRGPVRMDVIIRARALQDGRSINDYFGGVMDSLDGSHGPSFTYLPIVYEDDCQVAWEHCKFIKDCADRYSVRVVFLDPYSAPDWVLKLAGRQPQDSEPGAPAQRPIIQRKSTRQPKRRRRAK